MFCHPQSNTLHSANPALETLLSQPRRDKPHPRERHARPHLDRHVVVEREEGLDDPADRRDDRGRPPGDQEGERESGRSRPGNRPLERFAADEGMPPKAQPDNGRDAVEHPDRDEADRGILPPEDREAEERPGGVGDPALERHLPGAFRLVHHPREDRDVVAAGEGVAEEELDDESGAHKDECSPVVQAEDHRRAEETHEQVDSLAERFAHHTRIAVAGDKPSCGFRQMPGSSHFKIVSFHPTPPEGEEYGRSTEVCQPARRRSDMRVPVPRRHPLGPDLPRHAVWSLKRRLPETRPALRPRGGDAPRPGGAPRRTPGRRTLDLSRRGRRLRRPGRAPPPLGELPETLRPLGGLLGADSRRVRPVPGGHRHRRHRHHEPALRQLHRDPGAGGGALGLLRLLPRPPAGTPAGAGRVHHRVRVLVPRQPRQLPGGTHRRRPRIDGAQRVPLKHRLLPDGRPEHPAGRGCRLARDRPHPRARHLRGLHQGDSPRPLHRPGGGAGGSTVISRDRAAMTDALHQ